MLDKVFKLFFTEKKANKKTACLTLVRKSSLLANDESYIDIENSKQIKREDLTCLSKYFNDIKGLNLRERQIANLYTSR